MPIIDFHIGGPGGKIQRNAHQQQNQHNARTHV
jgi:hypothetical protein